MAPNKAWPTKIGGSNLGDLFEHRPPTSKSSSQHPPHLQIPRKRIHHPHLVRPTARGNEHLGTAHHDRRTPRPRRRHVEPIERIKKGHPPGRILGARAR